MKRRCDILRIARFLNDDENTCAVEDSRQVYLTSTLSGTDSWLHDKNHLLSPVCHDAGESVNAIFLLWLGAFEIDSSYEKSTKYYFVGACEASLTLRI